MKYIFIILIIITFAVMGYMSVNRIPAHLARCISSICGESCSCRGFQVGAFCIGQTEYIGGGYDRCRDPDYYDVPILDKPE